MKKVKIYSALFILLSTASCKKDFLDRRPYDQIAFDQAITNENDLELAVNGMYASMRVPALYGRTQPLIGDIMADNVYIAQQNSGRYINLNNYVILSNNGEAADIWSSAYSSILKANQIINSTVPENANVNQLKGEAYTVRAMLYFELLKVFALTYNPNLSAEGVPLVLTYDPTAKPARNTIGEVYAQIIGDLNKAKGMLTVQKNSEYVSLAVAKGLLAKVHQYKGEWAEAKASALEVLASGYALLDTTNYIKYWNNPAPSNLTETLFEVSIDANNSNGFDALCAMYDQHSYGDALCDSNLFKLYDTTDCRKSLAGKGYHKGKACIVVKKYPNFQNANDKDDAKVLRLSEIYLIAAEACHNLNDDANALIYLNQLVQKRRPSFTGYTSTGATLLNDITYERRLELAFEGNRFFDMNRLGLDVNRGLQYPSTALYLSINDHRRIFPIPQSETDANTNIHQNPGY